MVIGIAAASVRAIVHGSETVEELVKRVEAYRARSGALRIRRWECRRNAACAFAIPASAVAR
jgi:hypothetical protein